MAPGREAESGLPARPYPLRIIPYACSSAPRHRKTRLPDKIFHSALDGSPIGQCLLATTAGLDILAVNAAFLDSVSWTRAEVQGRPLFDAFPTDPDDAADTGMQDLGASIAAAITTRQSQTM
jgi:PAS domain-containing protein